MKALGLAVSDKKIFEDCIFETPYLVVWPNYATNWNHLNNFSRGPPKDHSCEVWSKSNKGFQRRCHLSEKVDTRRTTTDAGQRPVTIAHHEHFVLMWAKNIHEHMCTGTTEQKKPAWSLCSIYFDKGNNIFHLYFECKSFGELIVSIQ